MSTGNESALTLVSLPGGVRVRVANEDATRVSEAVENAEEKGKTETATAFNSQLEDLGAQMKLAQEEKAAADAKLAEYLAD